MNKNITGNKNMTIGEIITPFLKNNTTKGICAEEGSQDNEG
jgi:hypothetical protein